MSSTFAFKTKPYQHQLATWESTRDKTYWGYLMDPGLGKSKVTLDTAAWLYGQGKIDSVLVIAPAAACGDWCDPGDGEDHIKKHLGAPWKACLWQAKRAKTQKHQAEIEAVRTFRGGLAILVMNVETFVSEASEKVAHRFLDGRSTLVVVDESTRIKHHKALRSRAVVRLGRRAPYRRILTGSASSNSPLDLFNQGEFLQPGVFGHASFYSFRGTYAILKRLDLGPRQVTTVVGYQRLDQLQEKLAKFCTIIKKEDCLDLPPKIYQVRKVELSAPQKKLYEQMRTESIALLSGTMATAPIVLTQLQKLSQITCGYLRGEDANGQPTVERIPGPNPRLEDLVEMLEDVPAALIWVPHIPALEDIRDALAKSFGPQSVVTYYGANSREERLDARDRFNEGKARWFVSNKTGAFSLSIKRPALTVFYDTDFDREIREQQEDRVHGIGRGSQTESAVYVDYCAVGTVNEKYLKAQRQKQELSDRIIVSNWRELLAA